MSTTNLQPGESVVDVYESWYDYSISSNIAMNHERSSFITDTYEHFTDGNLDTTFVQGLLPNQVYRITFDIQKRNGTSWVAAETGMSEYITPTIPDYDPADALNQVQPEYGFYWNSTSGGGVPGTALYFKTKPDNGTGTTLTQTNFTATRTANGEPNQGAIYNNFTSNLRQVSLTSTGRPDAIDSSNWIPHSMDGYMFIFEHPEGYAAGLTDNEKWQMINNGYNSNTSLSGQQSLNAQFASNGRSALFETVTVSGTTYEKAKTYIGWNTVNRTQGVKIINNLRSTEFTPISVSLTSAQFETRHTAADLTTTRFPVIPAYGSDLGTEGGKLRIDRRYIISLLFYDKISQRFITVSARGNPKMFSITIPYGGEWTISLGSFRGFSTTNTNYLDLTEASAMTVDVSGLSVKGSVSNTDEFKIVMRATPVEPP